MKWRKLSIGSISASLAALSVALTVIAAGAHHGEVGPESEFPSANEDACNAHHGIFHPVFAPGGTRHDCTVENAIVEVKHLASRWGRGWIIHTTQPVLYQTVINANPFVEIAHATYPQEPVVVACSYYLGGRLLNGKGPHCHQLLTGP